MESKNSRFKHPSHRFAPFSVNLFSLFLSFFRLLLASSSTLKILRDGITRWRENIIDEMNFLNVSFFFGN